jgi:hypothetical protein
MSSNSKNEWLKSAAVFFGTGFGLGLFSAIIFVVLTLAGLVAGLGKINGVPILLVVLFVLGPISEEVFKVWMLRRFALTSRVNALLVGLGAFCMEGVLRYQLPDANRLVVGSFFAAFLSSLPVFALYCGLALLSYDALKRGWSMLRCIIYASVVHLLFNMIVLGQRDHVPRRGVIAAS